jgi:microcystin-dependent protein
MSQPYVGEIRMFGGNFAPNGWSFCDGSILPISENETLFQLIGTTYGGDGQSTFALPDLRSRVPIHAGNGPGTTFTLAQTGGTETVTVTTPQMPTHGHALIANNNAANTATPANGYLARASTIQAFVGNDPPTDSLLPTTITNSGGNQPHENMQPFLCVNFIISLYGIFPSQN